MRVKKGLIPFVILLVICGVWSSGIGGTDGEISVDSSAVLRYIRAAKGDKMSVAVDQMQKVARLTTGISLHLGLLSGQIQADPLISELLRLGNVTPSEIVALDAGKLTEAMGQIRELPNTLVNSKGIEEIEAKLEKIEEVRKLVKSSGDGKAWVGRKEFLDVVDFVTKTMNLKATALVKTEIGEFWSKKKMILAFDKSKPTVLTNLNFLLKEVLKDIEEIEKASADIARSDGKSWSYPKTSALESLGPLKSLTEAVAKAHGHLGAVESALNDEKKVFDSSKTNIETLSKLSSSLSKVVPDLKKVENIVRSRGSPKKKGLEYPGFLNGFWDIDNLIDDLGDDWMTGVVRGSSMAVSLRPLKSLFRLFRQVDSYFGMYKNEKANRFSNFLEHVENIKALSLNPKTINEAVDRIWACRKLFTDLDQPSEKDLQSFIILAEKLDGNMNVLKNSIDEAKNLLNTEETVKLLGKVKKLCVNADHESKIPIIIDSFNNSVEMKQLETVLKTAESALSDVDTFARTARASAVKITNETGKVDTYITTLQKYHPLFKCLHDLEDEKTKLVVEGMKVSQKFRNVEDDKVVTDGEEEIEKVLSSFGGFKELKAALENAKNQKVGSLYAFETLTDPMKQSKIIGAAVRGVSAMKEALEKKDQADVITLNSGVVEAQMKLVKLEQADVNNLNSVVQLKGPLATMYQKLDVWKKGVSEASAKGLVNSSSMFFTAKTVPGVTGDLGAMAKSVDVLIKAVTDNSARKKLVSVKKALESLNNLGLDFASYSTQFDASKNSLTALALFYTNYTAVTEPSEDFIPCDVIYWPCLCEECDPYIYYMVLSVIICTVVTILCVGACFTLANWEGVKNLCGKAKTKLKNKTKGRKEAEKKKSKPESDEQKTKTKSGESRSKTKTSEIVV